jgi:hypothetical protein
MSGKSYDHLNEANAGSDHYLEGCRGHLRVTISGPLKLTVFRYASIVFPAHFAELTTLLYFCVRPCANLAETGAWNGITAKHRVGRGCGSDNADFILRPPDAACDAAA